MIKYDNQMIKYYNSTCNFEEINERSPDIQILQTKHLNAIRIISNFLNISKKCLNAYKEEAFKNFSKNL